MRGCTFTVTFPAFSSDSASYSSEVSPVVVCLPGAKEGNIDGKVHQNKEEEKEMSPISILSSALYFGRTWKFNSQPFHRMCGRSGSLVHPSPSLMQSANDPPRLETIRNGSLLPFQELSEVDVEKADEVHMFSSLETNTEKRVQSQRMQEQHRHQLCTLPSPTSALETSAFVDEVQQRRMCFISESGKRGCSSSDQYNSSHVSDDIMDEKSDEEREDSSKLPRMLVVDDAKSNRKMLSRVLRSRCSVIVEAEDGQKAVDMVKESMVASAGPLTRSSALFDLILMDFVMPVMDGTTATLEIRKLGYRTHR